MSETDWERPWAKAFLRALATCGTKTEACRISGVGLSALYAYINLSPEFAGIVAESMAAKALAKKERRRQMRKIRNPAYGVRYRSQPKAIAHARKYRRMALLRKYGLTAESYFEILDRQGGCGVCGLTTPHRRSAFLHIDHCHKTGRVRGILCSKCNTAIGLLRDSVDLCEKAGAYLRSAAP